MPNVGPMEILVLLIIALIVFGPKRLPELGKSLGKGVREFRGSISGEQSNDEEAEEKRQPAAVSTAAHHHDAATRPRG
jgi:sec-independent protein translocase protein TatA